MSARGISFPVAGLKRVATQQKNSLSMKCTAGPNWTTDVIVPQENQAIARWPAILESYPGEGRWIGMELVESNLNPSDDIRYSRGVRLSEQVAHGDPRSLRWRRCPGRWIVLTGSRGRLLPGASLGAPHRKRKRTDENTISRGCESRTDLGLVRIGASID